MTSLMEKKLQILANRSSNFNQTKKFEINTKNYTRKELKSMIWTKVEISELDKKIGQPKKIEGCSKEGQKKYYNNGNDNVKQKSQSNIWMLRLKPKTRPIIPGNSIEKHKEKLNSK
jgi:hypothetical protein